MPEHNDGRRLIINNIPTNTRREQIKAEFGKYGPIEYVFLPRHRDTGKQRNFAFVEYHSAEDASKAWSEMHYLFFLNHKIEVDFADRKCHERRRRASSRGSEQHGSPRPSNDYLERRLSYFRNRSRSRSYSPRVRGHSSRSYSPASRHRENYYISAHHSNSKSPRTRPQEMTQKRRRGNSPISPRHSKSPRERPDKRKKQKRSHSPTLRHRENYHHVSPRHSRSKSSRNRTDERTRRKSRYSPEEKADPVEGGHGDDQNPCGIYITNLPNYVRYEDIERAFRKFGPIRDLYLPKYEETRKVRGIAYVEYDSPVQASEAMRDMQGKELLDRTISIDYTGDYRARNEVWRRRVRRRGRSRHGSRRPYNENLERGRSYSCNHSSSRSYSPSDRGHNSRKSYSPAPRHRERYCVSPHHSNSMSPCTCPQEMRRKRRRVSSISPHHSKSPRERPDERKMQKRSCSPTPSSRSKSSRERSNERTKDKSRDSDRHGSPRPSNDNSERRRSYSCNRSRSLSYSPHDWGHNSMSYSPASRHRETYDILAHHSNSKSPRTWPQQMRQKRGNSPISPQYPNFHVKGLTKGRSREGLILLVPGTERTAMFRHTIPLPSLHVRNRPDKRTRHKSSP